MEYYVFRTIKITTIKLTNRSPSQNNKRSEIISFLEHDHCKVHSKKKICSTTT